MYDSFSAAPARAQLNEKELKGYNLLKYLTDEINVANWLVLVRTNSGTEMEAGSLSPVYMPSFFLTTRKQK